MPVSSSSLVYGLEDKLPWGAAGLVSVQHVAAMVVGTITPPLILAGILNFTPDQTAYFVSLALLASAFGTLLQTCRCGVVGSGLLSVTGTSFSFLQPLILAGQAGGLALMLGLSLVTAPVQLILAPFLPRLRRVFTPLVSGIVVLLIGLSLIPSAMFGIVAPPVAGAASWAGGLVAGVVIAVIILVQTFGGRRGRLAAVLAGVATGYAVCAVAGWLPPVPPGDGRGGTIPHLLPFGFDLRAGMLLPFAFIYLVSLLEAMGDMTATAQLSGLETEGDAHWRRLRGGVLADGLTSFGAALLGGFPSTTYAQNNGVIQLTGVASRRIGPLMAVMLAGLGLFPLVGRLISAMPPAVLGALALMLFGLVAVSGFRLIAARGVGQREGLIVALSLAVGLGVPSQAEWVGQLPGFFRSLLESGIAAGGITALLLDGFMPKTPPAAQASGQNP